MNDIPTPEQCTERLEISSQHRQEIPAVVSKLTATCKSGQCYEHLAPEPMPSRGTTIEIIHQCRKILFPGYFTRLRIDPVTIEYYLGQELLLEMRSKIAKN